jgi:intraflagellar transport protein 74
MNLILDSVSSGLTRQQLLNETQALRERNEIAQNQLEGIFRERQDKDELNKELELNIENEKRKVNEMIYSLASGDREKYFELQGMAENLRAKNAEIHETIERLTKQKEKMMGSVLNSQVRRKNMIRITFYSICAQLKITKVSLKFDLFRCIIK